MVVRILFVDDSWDELEHLRRLTRHKRDEWDLSFACGSNDAIRHLTSSDQRPDVVVSEIELDGVDGIDLLKSMQAQAPRSIRILHSSAPSTAAVCRSVPWAHQFLPKPLDLAVFESTISFLRADPTAHESHTITALASSADALPVLPKTYSRVVSISNRPDFSLREIAEAIQDDVALTAATMKLVNSSFFAMKTDVTSVEQAVSLLGFDVIRGLVLANSLFDEDSSAAPWLDLGALSDRSQSVAALARSIAKLDGHPPREQALSFLAGMVHGTGLLLLARCKVPSVPSDAEIETNIDLEVDHDLFGIDRFALGAYLLRIWAFEGQIVEAVAGLGVPAGTVTGPTAESLRSASDLISLGGFSVGSFVEGDPETRETVAMMRIQLNARTIDQTAPRAA